MMHLSTHAQPRPLFPTVVLTPAEAEVFRRREKLSVSQWAERHRVVVDGPWEGPWSNAHTPYLVEPMDTWALVGVRRVTIVATPQSGKSQVAYNCWGFGVHYKQADAMFVLADQGTSEKIANQRLHKIVKRSPALRALIPETGTPLTKSLLTLRGSLTHMAWAGSDASLASFPVEHVFLDETDKYLGWSPRQKEADPVSLAEARITTFRYTGKSLKTSTPTVEQGYIWQALLNSQEVRCYTVSCTRCRQAQIMRHEQLRWDETITDPNRLEAEGLAWYECEHCGQPWHEAERRLAVRAGGYATMRWSREALWWEPVDPAESPASVAFWFNAFVSPFVSLGEIAAAVLRAGTDKQAEHNLFNKYLALPWRNEAAARDEDAVLALCDERREGLVPLLAVALTAGVDVQHNGFYFTIRAWAPGPERESWLVRAGFVDSWAALEKVLFQDRYLDAAGQAHVVVFGLVDAGDGAKAREINDWCQTHPPMKPSKGAQGLKMSQPFTQAKVETHTGLTRFNVNTTYYKNDLLLGKLHIAPADAGAWHLHSNQPQGQAGDAKTVALLLDYARQLCAEAQDERGVWQQIGRRPNHYLDCEVLQLVCADYLGIRYMNRQPATQEAPRPTRPVNRREAKW